MKKTLLTLCIAIASYTSLFAQWSTGTDIHNTNTGNVGIGTTSYSSLLTIGSSSTRGTVNIVGSTADIPAISLSDSQTGGHQYTFYNGTGDLSIYDQTAGAYRFHINSSGNIGIGTTGPLSKLSVGGAGNSRAAIYGLADGSAGVYDIGGNFTGTTYGVVATTTSGISIYGEATTGNGGYFTSSSGHGLIVANGNVGIGTTSPVANLDIVQTGSDNNLSLSSSGQYTTISFKQSGTLKSQIYTDNTNSTFNIQSASGLPIALQPIEGNVGIGTTMPDEKLSVLGNIHANEVKVDLSVPGPDYVFESDYKLPDLSELKTYVDKNHHLPEIPSAKELEKDGISLGDMNMKLLKKVEELTLFLIEKDEQVEEQKKNNQSQQQQINELRQQLTTILNKINK
ncbi:MAG: hypothetical protein ABI367_11395 [Mucilaginibacter sp.]